jgi:hypothetical protein
MGMRLIDVFFPDPHPATQEILQPLYNRLHSTETGSQQSKIAPMNPPGRESHGVSITTGTRHSLHVKTVVGEAVKKLAMKRSSEDAADNKIMTAFTQNASFTTATTEISNGKPNENANQNTSESTIKGTGGSGYNSNLEVSLFYFCEQPLN